MHTDAERHGTACCERVPVDRPLSPFPFPTCFFFSSIFAMSTRLKVVVGASERAGDVAAAAPLGLAAPAAVPALVPPGGRFHCPRAPQLNRPPPGPLSLQPGLRPSGAVTVLDERAVAAAEGEGRTVVVDFTHAGTWVKVCTGACEAWHQDLHIYGAHWSCCGSRQRDPGRGVWGGCCSVVGVGADGGGGGVGGTSSGVLSPLLPSTVGNSESTALGAAVGGGVGGGGGSGGGGGGGGGGSGDDVGSDGSCWVAVPFGVPGEDPTAPPSLPSPPADRAVAPPAAAPTAAVGPELVDAVAGALGASSADSGPQGVKPPRGPAAFLRDLGDDLGDAVGGGGGRGGNANFEGSHGGGGGAARPATFMRLPSNLSAEVLEAVASPTDRSSRTDTTRSRAEVLAWLT